ncbi:type II toxin-antitoxin system Phd/YefM family antitoxin [Chelativorans xinjiangense]|uniref:type II toxin-antitoxin system Phd/YefM family antitoxin n=1 Tax=Chelativorans xinjiangense TaxID=2681485 RepID=UPI001359DA74|nr:type II toxin-antitoxin system Phd/YefM family antitoxin [Chelativorans xinjiangense]
MHTVSATELARNTREILDMVVGGDEIVMVERNRTVIAWITPPERTMNAAQALAGLQPAMTPEQATAWLKESRGVFDEAVRDPWE